MLKSITILGIAVLASGCNSDGKAAGSSGAGASGGTGGAAGSATVGGSGGVGGGQPTGGSGGTGATAAGGTGGSAGGAQAVEFDKHSVAIPGAAWVSVADFNGDTKLDLVVSGFGTIAGPSLPNGSVSLLEQGADLDSWASSSIVDDGANIIFPNTTTLVDLDGDTDLDVVVPSGFLVCTAVPGGQPCGGLAWYERDGSSWVKHDVVPPGSELFYHHAEVVDFDGDQVLDLVTVGEKAPGAGGGGRAVAQWFKGNASATRFDTTPLEIGEGLGSVPTVIDVDGDNDLDIVSAEYFHAGGSFAWMERTADPSSSSPAGEFTRHVINADSGPSILLKMVPNLLGDGKLHAIGSNHTNTSKMPPDDVAEGVFLFDIPADPTEPWTKTLISSGIQSVPGSMFSPQAAPGVFATGDIDGDSDIDVLLSGDGDPHVYWIEQAPDGWKMHVLEDSLAQAGGIQIVDLNGDGKNELIVTGYEANTVNVYERK